MPLSLIMKYPGAWTFVIRVPGGMYMPIHRRVAEVTDGPLATRWAGLNPESLQGVLRAPGKMFFAETTRCIRANLHPMENATAKKGIGDRG